MPLPDSHCIHNRFQSLLDGTRRALGENKLIQDSIFAVCGLLITSATFWVGARVILWEEKNIIEKKIKRVLYGACSCARKRGKEGKRDLQKDPQAVSLTRSGLASMQNYLFLL